MPSFTVVKHFYVPKDVLSGLIPCHVAFMVKQLTLYSAEEGLCTGIIITVTFSSGPLSCGRSGAGKHRVSNPRSGPRINKSNVVCAEPMPGDKEMLREFTAKKRARRRWCAAGRHTETMNRSRNSWCRQRLKFSVAATTSCLSIKPAFGTSRASSMSPRPLASRRNRHIASNAIIPKAAARPQFTGHFPRHRVFTPFGSTTTA